MMDVPDAYIVELRIRAPDDCLYNAPIGILIRRTSPEALTTFAPESLLVVIVRL